MITKLYAPKYKGFTMIELLIVMGIILILASAVIVVSVGLRTRAQKSAAKADIAKLEQAIASFQSAYRVVPPDNFDELDKNNSLFIPVLGVLAFPLGGSVTNPEPSPYEDIEALVFALRSTNGKGPFIEFDQEDLDDLDGNGYPELIDPWGQPYHYRSKVQKKQVKLDALINTDFVDIWSDGPDKQRDTTNDRNDNDGDGQIDETDELVDDIANWNF